MVIGSGIFFEKTFCFLKPKCRNPFSVIGARPTGMQRSDQFNGRFHRPPRDTDFPSFTSVTQKGEADANSDTHADPQAKTLNRSSMSVVPSAFGVAVVSRFAGDTPASTECDQPAFRQSFTNPKDEERVIVAACSVPAWPKFERVRSARRR
jgi:hypothetical protein